MYAWERVFFSPWALYLGIKISDNITLHCLIVPCGQLSCSYAIELCKQLQLVGVKQLVYLKLQFKAIWGTL
jgi:hypothetical protein